jgi:NAD(P)H-hydrate repair Nnr-like enzyme with NAD(P)H-hydrate dehydratase domain
LSERIAGTGGHQDQVLSGPGINEISETLARSFLPTRQRGTHKWEVGALLVIGGSPTYIGAVALAAMAAQRCGAGIVQLAVPRGIISALVPMVPEAVYVPLPESESAGGARAAVSLIGEKFDRATGLLIGPGLGQDPAADSLLRALFAPAGNARSIGFGVTAGAGRTDSPDRAGPAAEPLGRRGTPTVIDADGLNWLAEQSDWPELLVPGSSVLTPHPGEMARLLNKEVSEVVGDPLATVREAARRSRQVVVLKYDHTAVSNGDEVLIAPAAPLSLASAGTGDVLGGMIAGFLSQGLKPFEAASLAVYLGCRAALRLETKLGTLGLVASDLPRALAQEIAILESMEIHGE